MNTRLKETWKIYQFNQKNGLFFALIFRVVTTTLYLLILSKSLLFALHMAGYSYLTASNIGHFLVKPWTIAMLLMMVIIGILMLAMETGCLLTLYQGAFYSRKLTPGEILAGGLIKLVDEFRKRNWKLGLLLLINYALANLYLIYRVLTHVKPVNFVMSEILGQPWWRFFLVLILLAFLAVAIPGLYTFHACMIEQKKFRDGYLRSWWLLRHRLFSAGGLLLVYYAAAILGMHLIYGFCVLITAAFITFFTDNNLALAILPAACDRIELVLVFLTSMFISLGNFAAITSQYFQFGSRLIKKEISFDDTRKRSVNPRFAALILAAAVGVSMFSLFDVIHNGSAITADMLNVIHITAHRGSSMDAPENTLAAVDRAIRDLADFVEIDVQESKDGVVVLCHDTSLKRVAGINRPVSSFTFEQLKELDVGTWFSSEYAGERIPSLEEVMEYCKGRININIEIKNLGKESELPGKVVELINQYQMKEQCVVTSSRATYLTRIKELDPEIRTGYIISAAYGDYYSSEYMDFISLRSSFITEKLVESAHEKGKAVHAWTVNSKSEMERMKMLGVDNIITDYPVLAREIVYREAATENLLEYLRLVLK